MIRLAILSFWHVHANDYARQAAAHGDTEIVAAWDEDRQRGEAEAARWSARFYADLPELLAQSDIDAVVVTTPTTMHCGVMLAAARAGKHIFTEKVLAPTLRECREIVTAVQQSGVRLVVSLPRLYAGYTQAITGIIADGLLGRVTLVRARLSHDGALSTTQHPSGWLPAHFFNLDQCAGGALIDLGCHPMYLARLFLGLPHRVTAQYGYVTGRAVEDNAVVLLERGDGAIGVVEAGFVNRFSPFTVEVHGTEGSLLYGTPEETLLVRSTALAGQGRASWVRREIPADQPSAFDQWVRHIQESTTAEANVAMALDLTRLMEAATISARNRRAVGLDELAY